MTAYRNYKIDFAHNTIMVDYKFNRLAQTINTPEYNLLKQLREDFPMMTIAVASHRETKKTHQNYRLTYANMIKFMGTFENYDELYQEFTIIRDKSAAAPQPYAYVRDWFLNKFPNYEKPEKTETKPVSKLSFKSLENNLSKTEQLPA